MRRNSGGCVLRHLEQVTKRGCEMSSWRGFETNLKPIVVWERRHRPVWRQGDGLEDFWQSKEAKDSLPQHIHVHINLLPRCGHCQRCRIFSLSFSFPPSFLQLSRQLCGSSCPLQHKLKLCFICSLLPSPFHMCRASPVSRGAPLQTSHAGQPRCHSGRSLELSPPEGHRAAFWQASMSERLWRLPRTIQIAFFTPHCTMPTLIHIICALAKCTLSDPSPCKTLQEESMAPVCC